MKYSIILPVRNGGHYIRACVNSILEQTYQNFDLLVLDNCSTDDTREWITSLNNDKITLITAAAPLTIEQSWARITSVKKNEFISIIGHDDILYPDFLQTIDDLVIAHPAASLYLTHFNLIDAAGKTTRQSKPMQQFYTDDELLKGILTKNIDITGTGYVMRAKDYDAMGGIPVKYPSLLYADFELWVTLAGISFQAVAPANCFAFRIHQSATGASQDSKLHAAMDLWINYMAGLNTKHEKMKTVIHTYGSNFLLFSCKGFAHRLLRSTLNKRGGLAVKKMVAQTKEWAKKLGVDKQYHPEKLFSIRIAEIIDSNKILRKLFLLSKKIYSKPVMKN